MFSARSAELYDAIYSFKDYPEEAEKVRSLIRERAPRARTLLDVACGTGAHLQYLTDDLSVEGLDLDENLLAIARRRNPGIHFHQADMVDFDLGHSFDVVTNLFSSIGYVETEERLHKSVATMRRHLAPGGLLLIEPWFKPEEWDPTFIGSRVIDDPDLKVARFNTSERVDGRTVMEFHYLIATHDGIEHFTETHSLGLWTHEQYVAAMEAAGLEVDYDEEGLSGRGMYVGSAS
jgi:SAM-dependent methyltransferase